MKDDGLVGAEVGSDDGLALSTPDGPSGKLGRAKTGDFGIEGGDGFWRHVGTNSPNC